MDIGDLRSEILEIVGDAIAHHPRSLQDRIGPSEIGTPCTRRLGYKLAGTPAARSQPVPWRPTVGTAVHSWLEAAFTAHDPDQRRWMAETRVHVGDIDGVRITGSCDLFDQVHGTVIDWKIVGPTTLKTIKKTNDPGDQYRTQINLYGAGFAELGLGPTTVAIVYYPSNGELRDTHVWTEPYDETLAQKGLARADAVAAAIRVFGAAAVIPKLPTSPDAHCNYCPMFVPGSTDLASACPGDPSATAGPGDQFTNLIRAPSG